MTESPRLARRLLRMIPQQDREFVEGDLEEEYAAHLFLGSAYAKAWYWRQVLGTLLSFGLDAVRTGRIAIPDVQRRIAVMKSAKARLVSLLAVGLILGAGAALMPLDQFMESRWHDRLSVMLEEDRWLVACVSDFEVVAAGVLSFKIEEPRVPQYVRTRLGRANVYHGLATGKRIVLPTENFVLEGNSDLCVQTL